MNSQLDFLEERFDDDELMEDEFMPMGPRTFSHDSLFGNTFANIEPIPNFCEFPKNILANTETSIEKPMPKLHVFNMEKKKRLKKQCKKDQKKGKDYRKNICGYITKKIIR